MFLRNFALGNSERFQLASAILYGAPRMSTDGITADELVDRFVEYLNSAGFEPKFQHEIPEELCTSNAEYEMFHWQIRSVSSNPCVEELAQNLPRQWPHPFRSLIDRYKTGGRGESLIHPH